MRSRLLIGLAVLYLSSLSPFAVAQEGPGQGGPNAPGRTFASENFQEAKARVLRMIEERRNRLDQEKTCVERSSNMEEMKKCRPEPPMGAGGKHQGGPGERRPPTNPPGERE